MEEQLISFETAKLAKEKGFNWKNIEILEVKSKSAFLDSTTQSLLQKWLREVHKINIFISSKTIENKTIFIPHGRTIPDTIKNNLIVDIIQYCTNNTYEEALEIGLQKNLKLI